MGTVNIVGNSIYLKRTQRADQYYCTRNVEKARARYGSEYEVVAGDVEDQDALLAALQGCQGVHINLDGGLDPDLERRGAEKVAAAAARVGIQRITCLSGASVSEENCRYPGTRAKFAAEAALRASGLPYTIFRATFFMETLPRFVRGARASILGRQPHPWRWVAAADYARMVATAYRTPETANKTLYVLEPIRKVALAGLRPSQGTVRDRPSAVFG